MFKRLNLRLRDNRLVSFVLRLFNPESDFSSVSYKSLTIAVLCGMLLAGFSSEGFAQNKPPLKSQNQSLTSTPLAKKTDKQKGFSIRMDEDLFQLEETVALIAASLNRISDKVTTLAINSFYFGRSVDADFRRKAEVIILEKVFEANQAVKLVKCEECQKLETKISKGVLTLRKGLPSGEARKGLAKKLGADGFIDLGLFREGNQITVYLKVMEASTGAIILVDELAGRPAPKRKALTIALGRMNFSIDSVQHNALVLGVNETVQLTGRLSFGVDINIYSDNNKNNADKVVDLKAALFVAPYLGIDMVQMHASTSRWVLQLGLGQTLAAQFNYGNFYKIGTQFIVGDRLVITYGINSFQEETMEGGNIIKGSGSELLFGYRF